MKQANNGDQTYVSIFGIRLYFWILMLIVATAGIALAEDAIKPGQINPIAPPPYFDTGEIDYADLVDRHFSLKGTLDAVYLDERRIVVDDSEIYLAGGFSLSGIQTGEYVGVRLDKTGKAIEIQRLQGVGNFEQNQGTGSE